MNTSDIDRVRFAAPLAPPASRSPAGQRFDDALRESAGHGDTGRQPGDEHGDRRGGDHRNAQRDDHRSDHRDDRGGDREPSQQQGNRTFAGHDGSLPPAVLQMVRASLGRALSDAPSDAAAGTDLHAQLMHDIADGVRAGRALPGDRWRMLVRLQPALLPSTEVDISCAGAQLAVVLRTANEDAYRQLVSALPRLNEALAERGVEGGAVVFLVALRDLQ